MPIDTILFKILVLYFSIMEGFNPGLGRLEVIIIFTLMVILIPSAQAFPLHGGNGIVNATIYGIMKYEYGNGLYVDISASDVDVYDIELIDRDNNTYNGNKAPYRSTLRGFPTETEYKTSIRDILLFNVPDDTIAKRLRIVPAHSVPFYINWTEMPEATGRNVTLKYYGATFEPNGMRWRQGDWNFDLNITNSANRTVEYNSSNFALVDQFGWAYPGKEGDASVRVPAGESMRFNVRVPFVSELSRPLSLLFKGMKLDISAWA
ncbi:Uncharacterised protein [uncultured archaeon]|nr:Uncharacterised protein [uncultured archaeon]